ncbi:MAG: hypothetical protein Q8M08_03480 [Bacteroidales bacterium]|nr:hypothetical protein [Bacteroidales bacterium]
MKRIFFTTILIACFVAIAGMQGIAQTSYAKVTVYTNSQQYVYGTLQLDRLQPTYANIWSMPFSFQADEGQIVDGGYMYQRWILLAYPIPQTGTLYELVETAYGQSVNSRSYAPLDWPLYVILPGNDFRSQGGQ